ncbi:MAG: phage regulatory protein/antirepressor Ant [Prevotella sp.]|nr:phage regulatory protein/antirepressor Ant [Prevotella sp.]
MTEKTNFIQKNDDQRMSSLEIAEITKKQHKDVLKAIRNMEPAWVNITERKFALSSYKDSTGRQLPCYLLTKVECLYVATKFNDEARAKLVLRWEQLENEIRNPSSSLMTRESQLAHAVLLAQQMLEEQSLMLEEKQRVIEEQRPKADFCDAVMASVNSCLIGNLAKLIRQNGVECGERRLFCWLRENDYLGKRGERYNIPNQRYIDQELFELKETVHTENERLVTRYTTKVTGKGQEYFINGFISGRFALN